MHGIFQYRHQIGIDAQRKAQREKEDANYGKWKKIVLFAVHKQYVMEFDDDLLIIMMGQAPNEREDFG